jgi:hypothetical protein
MKLKRFHLPLATLAILVATVSAAASVGKIAKGADDNSHRTRRVVASGRLTGTRERQRVVTWHTKSAAHLAIETLGRHPRVLWQTEGGDSESRVDQVRVVDLDRDGIPEILSLWWKDSSAGAVLRATHWDRHQESFVELRFDGETDRVHSYRVVPARGLGTSNRLVVETGSRTVPRRSTAQGVAYELRGLTLIPVGGGRVVTTQGESGIEGQAVISPSHPGPQRQGAPSTAPYKTTLVVWRADGDQEVARFETGSDGRFRVALPPGTYRVGSPPQKGRFAPRAREETITVKPGMYAQVTIDFDSGMR